MAPKRIPFVENVAGSKNLHYRRDVPPDVRAVVGKTRWSESLRTAIPKEAARRARELAAEHDRIIAAARQPDPMTLLSPDERETINDAGGLAGYLAWLDERSRDAAKLLDDAESMREWAAADGPADEIPEPEWARGEIAAMEAKARAISDHLAREVTLIDKVKPLISTPTALAEALETLPADGDRATFSAIFEAWKRARKASSHEQFKVPVRTFEQLHGPLLLSQITKRHVREFRDHLAKDGRLQESTASKHLRCVGTLLRFAVSEGYIEHSPAEGIQWQWEKRKVSDAKIEARRTLTVTEVQTLFEVADAIPADDHKKLDTKWFMRLALFTGARPEELAQLAPRDVTTINGVRCIRIHDEGDNKLKTPSSLRNIPLHPKLIEGGFLDFVKARKSGALLFATLKADGRGRIYSRMQRRFSRMIRGRCKITDPRVVPYSARHTFKDCLRLAEAPREVADYLMGHTTPDRAVADDYGSAQIAVLSRWLEKIDLLDKDRSVSGFRDDEA